MCRRGCVRVFCVCSVLCVLRAHSATGSSCVTAAGKGSSHPDRLLLIPRLCCLTSVSKTSGKCQQVGAEMKDACVFLRTDRLRGGRGPDSGSCCFRTNPGPADVEAWSMHSLPVGPLVWLLSAAGHSIIDQFPCVLLPILIPQVKVKHPRMTDLCRGAGLREQLQNVVQCPHGEVFQACAWRTTQGRSGELVYVHP